MKVTIMYDSKTGNTKQIGEAIASACNEYDIVYVGVIKEQIDADLYFIGSWTDKGNCSSVVTKVCQTLHHKKIAIFGTCGFGGSPEYQETLSQRFIAQIPADNRILDHFYCMGKMPLTVRDRYVSMLQEHPDDKKLAVSIENFDQALTHPNTQDEETARIFARRVLKLAKEN